MSEQNWRKSRYSGSQANCVEVSGTADALMVRDTKDRAGGTLGFTVPAWRVFTSELKKV
jgi:hypothetical protein